MNKQRRTEIKNIIAELENIKTKLDNVFFFF